MRPTGKIKPDLEESEVLLTLGVLEFNLSLLLTLSLFLAYCSFAFGAI